MLHISNIMAKMRKKRLPPCDVSVVLSDMGFLLIHCVHKIIYTLFSVSINFS